MCVEIGEAKTVGWQPGPLAVRENSSSSKGSELLVDPSQILLADAE